MTKEELKKRAFEECCNENTTVRYGILNERPFWNTESEQFMYVPAFHFPEIRGIKKYRYDAVDEKGIKHTFIADNPNALLTPIWAQLPEGVVTLTVTALNEDGSDGYLVGARTFFRLAPFDGDYAPAVCTYKECALKAYEFALKQDFVQYWLKYGTPDPHYDLNVYPSKMISALIEAMLSLSRLCPEKKEEALKIAVNAADFLVSITPHDDVPLKNLPPTYNLEFCPDPDEYGIHTANWDNAVWRSGCIMMIYPPAVGSAYIKLYKATGDKKYFNEAINIGNYFLDTVENNGSWYLMRSLEDGKPIGENYIAPIEVVVPFLMALYECTGEDKWKRLADGAVNYVFKTQLSSYNWEGQFEDSLISVSYSNLSHYPAGSLLRYIAQYRASEPEMLDIAKELMRFVEDQFVIWKRPYPWKHRTPLGIGGYDSSLWHTPAALEQHFWYVPIDASTASVVNDFNAMYKATGDELYLAKAKALANQLTVMQEESGRIPTHWMNTDEARGNFWFNCLFYSCRTLESMSEYDQNV